jgi:membrane peptidoglycan carboxypeptidase
MIDLGERMGISTWEDRDRFGLSLTLGGGDVRMIDMASVYGIFANLGIKVFPDPFIKITTSKGEITYSRSNWTNDQVLNPGVAYIINDILADDQARQIAFGRNSMLQVPGKIVSVKTGTTNLMKDNWAIGYTSQFLVATWVGNNDSSSMSRVASGITGATPIWRRLTDYMLKLYPETGWEIPNDLERIKICNVGNGGVCQGCSSGRTEYFLKSNSHIAACSDFKADEAINDKIMSNKDEKQTWRITNAR